MKQGIVIGTGTGREEWLNDFMKSVEGCKYPIKVYKTDNFELDCIDKAMWLTDWDEFLFLADSTVIQDLKFFDLVFKGTEGKSVSVCQEPCLGGMYMMKYRREILKQMPIPKVNTKKMAVYWEIVFNEFYCGLEGIDNIKVLFPELTHSDTIIERHGRENMVMANQYIRRYKGSWGQKAL